jgi:hypothetical protein
MFPWETITPFGAPVEPDVYWTSASVSGTTAVIGRSPSVSAARSSSSSVAVHRRLAKRGCRSISPSTVASVLAVVSASAASASAMIASMRGTWELLRGGYAGTATRPA